MDDIIFISRHVALNCPIQSTQVLERALYRFCSLCMNQHRTPNNNQKMSSMILCVHLCVFFFRFSLFFSVNILPVCCLGPSIFYIAISFTIKSITQQLSFERMFVFADCCRNLPQKTTNLSFGII